MKVLITGVTGFVGTNLVASLSQHHAVFGHGRDPGRIKALFAGQVTAVDSINASTIDALGIEAIIHAAGIAHDLGGKYNSSDYERVNTHYTIELYNEFNKSACSKFVFISSIKAAIEKSTLPVNESIVPSPDSEYGRSKLKAEQYLMLNELAGKAVYILRPCMIHGPGNKGNLNLLFKAAQKGWWYPFGAFRNHRSFLSVDNLCFVVREILEGRIKPGLYHLADDGTLSTKELYEIIAKVLKRKAVTVSIPKPLIEFLFKAAKMSRQLDKITGDMVVSNEKILAGLGRPLPLSIREGVEKTIRSFVR